MVLALLRLSDCSVDRVDAAGYILQRLLECPDFVRHFGAKRWMSIAFWISLGTVFAQALLAGARHSLSESVLACRADLIYL